MSQVQVTAFGVQRKVLKKGTRSMIQRDLGIIIPTTQMSQENVGRLPVEGVAQKGRQFLVGEMADSAQNTLLDAPGIGPNLQHLLVMIGFHDEPVTSRQVFNHRRGEFSQIGDQSTAYALCRETKAYRFRGVMRDRKGFDLKVANGEGGVGAEAFPAVNILKSGYFFPGPFIHENRHLAPGQEPGNSADMVRVSVSEKNGIDSLVLKVGLVQTSLQTARAKTQVDQNAGLLGGDVRAIPTASTSQDGYFHGEVECIS